MVRRKNGPRLSLTQLRCMQQQSGISFMGLSTDWPLEYEHLFSRVQAIFNQRFKDHPSRETGNPSVARGMQAQAMDLVQEATNDYHHRVNEGTLRAHTEHPLFRRFSPETECRFCQKQTRHAYSELSQPQNVSGSWCQCLSGRNSWHENNDQGKIHVFSDRCKRHVEADPTDDLGNYNIPNFKPDRVVGINRTRSLEQFCGALPHLRHSPFRDAAHILYPFLVVESKPGGQTAGFDEIEIQTAFPLRNCIMLQHQLQQASAVALSPLVWFMAYQADEWRLSACIWKENKMRVHELWSGRARHKDGALQLLLIMDFICGWARSLFRPEILTCLAEAQRYKQVSRPGMVDQQSISSSLPSRTHSTVRSSLAHADLNGYTPFTDTLNELSLSAATRAPVTAIGRAQTSWKQEVTIRHANTIIFEFEHIALPEHPDRLSECLVKIGEAIPRPTLDVGEWLRTLFGSSSFSTDVSDSALSNQKDLWLDKKSSSIDLSRTNTAAHRCCVLFDTYLDSATWYTVRRVWFLTCSRKAAKALLDLPGDAKTWLQKWIDRRGDDHHMDPWPALRPLLVLPNKLSLHAAANSAGLVLNFEPHLRRRRWHPMSEEWFEWLNSRVSVGALVNACNSSFDKVSSKRRKPVGTRQNFEVRRREPSDDLDWILSENMPRWRDCVLLQKGKDWPSDSPKWCLVFFGGKDHGSEFLNKGFLTSIHSVKTLVRSMKDGDDVYVIGNATYNPWKGYNGEGKDELKFLEEWAVKLIREKNSHIRKEDRKAAKRRLKRS